MLLLTNVIVTVVPFMCLSILSEDRRSPVQPTPVYCMVTRRRRVSQYSRSRSSVACEHVVCTIKKEAVEVSDGAVGAFESQWSSNGAAIAPLLTIVGDDLGTSTRFCRLGQAFQYELVVMSISLELKETW
jgi:hypothetical protein